MSILVPYFVPNDLYPILPYPYNIPPLLLSPLVTTGLFFLSLSVSPSTEFQSRVIVSLFTGFPGPG